MSLLNTPPSSTSCLPTDPTCIFSFLTLVTKKVEKIRTMSREERHTEKTCFPGSTMLYKNLKTFNHSKCVKTFPIILKCGLFIIYKSIIREFKSKPYAVTVSSFPLKHWGRASKNWGRISFQWWLLHAHCITLTAKCWMNHSHRFSFPPLFVHS